MPGDKRGLEQKVGVKLISWRRELAGYNRSVAGAPASTAPRWCGQCCRRGRLRPSMLGIARHAARPSAEELSWRNVKLSLFLIQ